MKIHLAAAAVLVLLAGASAMYVTTKMAGMKRFVYEEAKVEEQDAWLHREAKRYRRDFAGNLPTGWGFAPRLEVARIDVDRIKRTIHVRIEAKEEAALVENADQIEHKWLKQACLKFIHDSLYRHGVTIVDSFHLMTGERVFQAVVSPERCDGLYPSLALPNRV